MGGAVAALQTIPGRREGLVTSSDEGGGEWGSPFSIMKGKQETEW